MPVTISGTSGITTPGAALSSGSITFADSTTLPSATFSPVYPITASVSANALTVTLNACALAFRSSSLTSGSTSTIAVSSPISVTVSSGSTLGTVNATQSTIMVLAINNGGTVELAVVNIAGGNNLDETTLISTTAEGGAGAADSNNVIYSTTARSNVPFRVVGAVISTQTTAGTWATAPSTIQGTGGQAFTSLQSIGYGQTWQNVTGSRANATTYYNTTGKPIMAYAQGAGGGGLTAFFTVAGVALPTGNLGSGTQLTAVAIVPPGQSYSFTHNGSSLTAWCELR